MTNPNDPKAKRTLTPEERRAREEAINYARASVKLEGFTPSPAAEERARQFIEGEIDMAEFIASGRRELLGGS